MSATASASVASETVKYVSDGFTLSAFLARPSAGPQAPGVVILHEWWGLSDHTKEIARRFAAEGFVALAPDLYSRQGNKVTQNPQEATALMNALSSQQALRDLNVAIRWLRQQPYIAPQAVGIVGFSMGGTLALTQATHNSDLKAAVVFYGKVPPIESVARLLCPVQFHWPAKDGWVTRQEAERLQQGLEATGKPGEVIVYPQADHGFFNAARPDAYRAEDARAAWQKTLAFLRAHLR